MIWVMNAGLPIRDNTKFIFWSKLVICKPLLKLGKNFWKSISIVYGLLSDRKKEKKTEWFWSANNFLQFNYYKSPEKEIRLQGSSSLDAEQSVCCERRNFHFSRAWNKETNLSPRQDSNPDLPDTGGVLLARVLHTAGISNAKSVPCGVQASAEEHHTARWIPWII